MKEKDDTTIHPSNKPGHVWRVYPYKPGTGYAPYVAAVEAELTAGGGYTTTLYLGGGNPRAVPRIPIDGGRMTAKAVERARESMLSVLRERGYLAEEN